MKKIIFFISILCAFPFIFFSQSEEKLREYPDFITFMNEYNKTMISSHKKLVLMNKPKKLQKLGKEVKYGDISGEVNYKTKIRGFSGIVIMDYKNYSDFGDWIFNGQTNVKANLYANGKMFGTVNVSGKYSAKVIYDNILIRKGNAGGGYYVIQYEDGSSGKVMWNEILPEEVAIDDADEEVTEISNSEDKDE